MPRQSSPLSIENVLLGFLEHESIHGYDLYKRLNSLESIGMVWRIKQSQLYALLDRLEEEGLVSSTIVPGDSHPNRKQFTITGAGLQNYLAWRSSPVRHGREIRMEFLAKLYFAQRAGVDIAQALIDAQQLQSAEWLAHMNEALVKTAENQVFEKIVHQYRIAQTEAVLAWLDGAKNQVKGVNKNSGVK
jgi:PadR family transcriptional regulator, regulatory protein AphA